MKIVIFGLTISSSWGNGHATLWRGLCKALANRGHEIVFFEKDVPYYAKHRDLLDPAYAKLILYDRWHNVAFLAKDACGLADVAIVTSYCSDGIAASELVTSSSSQLKVFYDLDAPVTLQRLKCGEKVDYVGDRGFTDFDLVLSYTGGRTLAELRLHLGARRAAPLYGSVDPQTHYRRQPVSAYVSDFSYLGTYAADRQPLLKELFLNPARRQPGKKFVIAGAQYPENFPWDENIYFVQHLPPFEHAAFFSSSRLTLNITRQAMAEMGYCPSGRLFEAAACGTPIVTDVWAGLERFFTPGKEVIAAGNAAEVIRAVDLSSHELQRISKCAQERVLDEHTADVRARELEEILESTFSETEMVQV